MWLENLFSVEMTGNQFGFTVQNLLYSDLGKKRKNPHKTFKRPF